jgi:hypothetical protein
MLNFLLVLLVPGGHLVKLNYHNSEKSSQRTS